MKRSLNKKFAIIFLSLLSFLLLIILIVIQMMSNLFFQNYIEDDVMNNHVNAGKELQDVFDEAVYCYTRMTKCNAYQELFGNLDYSKKCESFISVLNDASLPEKYINVVMGIEDTVFYLNSEFNPPDKEFIDTLKVSRAASLLCSAKSAGLGYVEIGRRLQNSLYNAEGYVVFYISTKALSDTCTTLNDGAGGMITTFVMDENHTIIAKNNGLDVGKSILEKENYPLTKQTVMRKRLNGKRCLVAITEVETNYDIEWYVVTVSDLHVLKKDYNTITFILLGVSALCFIIVLILALKVSKNTVAPINRLSEKIASVDFQHRKGLFDIGSDGDEIYELEKNYDEMLKRLFSLMDENKQNMETQRKLEIEALQMQINPHFLYNTLDAIAWMAKIKKQPEIETLVINLAKFFRLSLHKGDKYITLNEEAEIITHFLAIEKIRFPDTINYECSIPENLGEYKVVKLILQPIVENCIKHGFRNQEGVGTISIEAQSFGDDIEIYVKDNGCGFLVPDDFFTKKDDTYSGGYGLYNVNERIQLEYGKEYGLSVHSVIGEGTTVTIKIRKKL